MGENNEVKLKRQLGMWHGTSVIVSSVIGSGIFITPGEIVKNAGSFGMALVIWVICVILIVFGCMMYIELGCMMPKAGGDYEYILQTLGPVFAFTFVWTRIILIIPCVLAIGGISFANYLLQPIFECGAPVASKFLLATLAILLLAYLNCRSVKLVTKIQLMFAIGKALALLVIICNGVYGLIKGGSTHFQGAFDDTSPNALSVITAIYSTIFTFSGWNYLNYVMEELRQPEKNLPRAAAAGVSIIGVLYVLVNVAYFAVLSRSEVINSSAIAVDAMKKTVPAMGTVVTILVSLSVFGLINSLLFTTSRLIYSAARNTHLPLFFSLVNVNFLTPVISVSFLAVISLIFFSFGSVNSLVYVVTFGESVFYIVTFIGFIWLRWKKPDLERRFKAFLPIVVIFALSMTFITVIVFIQQPIACLISSVLILCGTCVFYLSRLYAKSHSLKKMNEFTTILQKITNSIPAE